MQIKTLAVHRKRRCHMPKYLFHGSYTEEGLKGAYLKLYRKADVIKHLLALLPGNDHELFCTYSGNTILAVFTVHKR
jgi:hypothetical protein